MNIYKSKQAGLIKLIIVIVIAIAILSYYGVDIKDFFTSPKAQENFGFIGSSISNFWNDYLAEPATKLWGIWVDYIWEPFINIITKK